MGKTIQTMGKRLATTRLSKGLSLEDVQRKTGVDKGNLSRVERDKDGRNLSEPTLKKLARLYGCRPGWLRYGR